MPIDPGAGSKCSARGTQCAAWGWMDLAYLVFIEKAAHLAVGIGYAEFSVATTDYGRSNWTPKLLLAAARVKTRVLGGSLPP